MKQMVGMNGSTVHQAQMSALGCADDLKAEGHDIKISLDDLDHSGVDPERPRNPEQAGV